MEGIQALFKARFEQALESQKLNIKKIEQQLRRMGVNPEDPAAMASIQRVASTFFNAIDQKEGSPYVFREGKQSITEPAEGFEESEPTADSDQEELDRFIAEIEDAADKEYEAEEAKEKEEFGRIRYWNKEEFGGRYRRSDASTNDDRDVEARGSRVWQTTHPKRHAVDSDDEENTHSDNDDDDEEEEWHFNNSADASDLDSNSEGSDGTRRRFKESRRKREKQNNPGIGRARDNESSSRHAGAKFRGNMTVEDSESEGMLSDVENAMWESEDEEQENNDSGYLRKLSDSYKSSSSDDEYAHQTMSNKKSGARDHEGKVGGSAQYHDSFDAPKSVRGKKHGVNKIDSESIDEFSCSENWLWPSDAAEETGDYPTNQNSNNVIKSDIPKTKRRTPKETDEAWDSD